ncbi:hypothetical protein IP91_01764 [Pseudoduganella lurida]|uniref:Uncharacterized protein n=1 Tax=Pseudoduganella lurida TaxID=1036180 RepID=A0A562RF04_9BURK|nr:hypothetical protein [Pseudoduganella lurida]TWI67647.1 hypothetical protein IP91_01764 [Pseudoduganella lurida]
MSASSRLPLSRQPVPDLLPSEGGSSSGRVDIEQGAIVEEGIALQGATGSVCALEYLKSRGVGPAVIERVLLHPGLRRRPATVAVMHKN